MAKLNVKFGLGIQKPAKLGTLILKPTSELNLSYAQNIDVQNDEYGDTVAVPGPALVTITNNTELTGVPIASALYVTSGVGWLYFLQGNLGATDYIRRIVDVEPNETPSISTAAGASLQITHSGHASVVLTDILIRDVSGTKTGYIAGKDATDGWYHEFNPNNATIAIAATQLLTTFDTGREPKLALGADNKVYIGHGFHIDNVNTAGTYANNAITLRNDLGVTAMAPWRLFLAVAFNTDYPYTFATRKGGGQAGVVLWDYTPNTSWSTDYILSPSRYISCLVPTPSGNLLAFGGVDEGRCTIYEFTGVGFNVLHSYIGDLPLSRHSVDFDGQGRVVFITADGQICRYTISKDIFEHLGTIATTAGHGGLLRRLVGGTGNEFIAATGTDATPDTFLMKRVVFGSYLGDGDAADGVTTPLVVSGPLVFPALSTINNIELVLNKALVSGENLELRLYRNGSTTAIAYGDDINSTNDGTDRSAIRREQAEVDVSMAHIGVAFKNTDAQTTSPGVIEAIIDYDETE